MSNVKDSEGIGVGKGVDLLAYVYDPTMFYIRLDGEKVHGLAGEKAARLQTTAGGTILLLHLQATSSWVSKLKPKLGQVVEVETGYTPDKVFASFDEALSSNFKAVVTGSTIDVGTEVPHVVFTLDGTVYNEQQFKEDFHRKLRAQRG